MRTLPRLALGLVVLGTLILLARWNPGQSQDEPQPEKVPDKFRHSPSAVPDRVVLTWTGDPAHTQAVTWRTDATVKRAVAEIAPAEGGAKFVRNLQRLPAATEPLKTDLNEVHFHSVNFTGLEPSTTYVYRVGDGVNWSEFFQFTTAAAGPEPFSFIYFGDAQNDIKSHWSRVIRQAYRDAPQSRFLLHAGDLVNSSVRDAEWGDWFGAGGWLNGTVPSLCVAGNHEYPSKKIKQPDGTEKSVKNLCLHWRPQFTLPENGLPELAETNYCLDYQGVRFIVLNSNERIAEQAQWLNKVLDHNPNRWTIVSFHHPIYSGSKKRDNPEQRLAWKPLFDRYRVDLVLQGHDHLYTRTGLEVPDVNVPSGVNAQSLEGGTIYVISVSGPKNYELNRANYLRRVGEGLQLYQVIRIAGDKLHYRAHTATGELYDGFTLTKRPGERNDLVEEVPPTPEVRRPAATKPEKQKPDSDNDKPGP